MPRGLPGHVLLRGRRLPHRVRQLPGRIHLRNLRIVPPHARTAVSVVPQLTALASWGGRARLLAALRTPEEHLSRSDSRIVLSVIPASCTKVAHLSAFGHLGAASASTIPNKSK